MTTDEGGTMAEKTGAVDKDGKDLRVGSRVRIDGAGFTNRHRGTVLSGHDGVNVYVRIDGLLGNPYCFTPSFDGVIEDLEVATDG